MEDAQENNEEVKVLSFNELFAVTKLKEVEVYLDGGSYTFKYKDLSWKDRMGLGSRHAKISNEDGISFDMSSYYLNALMIMLDQSTFPNLSVTTLQALDASVLDQLTSIVPPPWGDMLEADDTKKK